MKKEIAIVIALLLNTSTLHSTANATQTTPAVDQLHSYLLANYNQFGGDMKMAYDRYKELIQSNAPSYSYKGYIHLLYETGNYAHVLQLMPKVSPVFQDTQDVQIIFAKVLEHAGQSTQADTLFIQLNEKFKNNQEIAFQAANSYLRRKEPENAIKVIDNLLNSAQQKPNNFVFYFMKSQILLQLNKKNDALKNVQKSLELHPRFDKGWLLYALLNEQEGKLNDAIKGYNTFIELTGSNKEIEEHLLQLLFKQKIEQQSHNKGILLNKQCGSTALLLFEQKKYEDALKHIDVCLKSAPNNDENKLIKIHILTAMKRIDAITDLLTTWMIEEPTKQIWFQTLHLMARKELSHAQCIQALRLVESAHPHAVLPVLYLADMYTRTHNSEKSKVYLKKAALMTSDPHIKSDVLFQLSLNLYEKGQFAEMEQHLLEAKKLNENHAPATNLLAYHYAIHENKLAQAQKLIEPIVKKYKNNPHYLDTQALIYLKQHRYADALNLLERLAQKAPCDYTILIHLCEAQKGAGKTDHALATLEKAVAYAKTTQEKKECQKLTSQWKIQKA